MRVPILWRFLPTTQAETLLQDLKIQNDLADDVLANAMKAVDEANATLGNHRMVDLDLPDEAILARGVRTLDRQIENLTRHANSTRVEILRLKELDRQVSRLLDALVNARVAISDDIALVDFPHGEAN